MLVIDIQDWHCDCSPFSFRNLLPATNPEALELMINVIGIFPIFVLQHKDVVLCPSLVSRFPSSSVSGSFSCGFRKALARSVLTFGNAWTNWAMLMLAFVFHK